MVDTLPLTPNSVASLPNAQTLTRVALSKGENIFVYPRCPFQGGEYKCLVADSDERGAGCAAQEGEQDAKHLGKDGFPVVFHCNFPF